MSCFGNFYTSVSFLPLSPPLLGKGKMSTWRLYKIFTGIQEEIFLGDKNKNHSWVLSIDYLVSNICGYLAA